jgi:hypothetical protein
VFMADNRGQSQIVPFDNLIDRALKKSPMYQLVDVLDLKPPSDTKSSNRLNQFLDGCAKRGVFIVLFITTSDGSHKVSGEQRTGGDVANEFTAQIAAKVYSTRKKQQRTEITITEKASSLVEKDLQQQDIMKERLKVRGTEKLAMRLLENDVF